MDRITHDDLITAGKRWLNRSWRNASEEGHGRCSLILTELVCNTVTGEVPDVIGWYFRDSILIECKVSRSDFLADRKKVFRQLPELGAGVQRWYLTPAGLLTVADLPEGWGLLEADARARVAVIRPSGRFPANRDIEIAMLLSAIRRMKP